MTFTGQQLLTARQMLERMWYELLEELVLAANDKEPNTEVIASRCRSLSEIGSGVEALRYALLEAPPLPSEQEWLDSLAELLARAHSALVGLPEQAGHTHGSLLVRDAYRMVEERLEELHERSVTTPRTGP